jgi:hypothetical protein
MDRGRTTREKERKDRRRIDKDYPRGGLYKWICELS